MHRFTGAFDGSDKLCPQDYQKCNPNLRSFQMRGSQTSNLSSLGNLSTKDNYPSVTAKCLKTVTLLDVMIKPQITPAAQAVNAALPSAFPAAANLSHCQSEFGCSTPALVISLYYSGLSQSWEFLQEEWEASFIHVPSDTQGGHCDIQIGRRVGRPHAIIWWRWGYNTYVSGGKAAGGKAPQKAA